MQNSVSHSCLLLNILFKKILSIFSLFLFVPFIFCSRINRAQLWVPTFRTAPVLEVIFPFILSIDVLENPFFRVLSLEPRQPATRIVTIKHLIMWKKVWKTDEKSKVQDCIYLFINFKVYILNPSFQSYVHPPHSPHLPPSCSLPRLHSHAIGSREHLD